MDFEKVFPYFFPFFFIFLWATVLFILAYIGGWSRLAQYYQTQSKFEGERWNFKSGRMGVTNYSGSLTIGVNDRGLYLAVFPIFRVGHPPLFIPWYDITTYEVCKNENGTHLYGGFYHMVGRIVDRRDAKIPIENTRKIELSPLTKDFKICFTTDLSLVPKQFSGPILQMEFFGDILWVLEEDAESGRVN